MNPKDKYTDAKTKFAAILAAALMFNPLFSGFMLAIGMAVIPGIVAPQPAAAAWWDNVTGVYVNLYGSQYYYGSYVQNPNPQFSGSTWEIMCGSNVCAHGYSRSIPRGVWWLANRLGR